MLRLIERRMPDLSRAEQRVARWVLAHPRRAAASTLAAVADACSTSEPTVIRFCRHLGLQGFRHFTLRMTEALSRPATFIHHSVSRDDTPVDAVAKVMDASIRALVEVRAQASSMPFSAAIEAIRTARQLVFVGLGASGIVARDAEHKFFRLGMPCSSVRDTPTMLQVAALAQANDVFVIISHQGQRPELARTALAARARGAKVITLSDPVSALAKAGDIAFDCHTPEDTNVYTPQSSRLAHLALLDSLQVSVALALGEVGVENLQRSKEALDAERLSRQ